MPVGVDRTWVSKGGKETSTDTLWHFHLRVDIRMEPGETAALDGILVRLGGILDREREVNRLRALSTEENAKKLERRALAKLTKRALGGQASDELPRL